MLTREGAYLTRGSGHDQHGAYTEAPDEYQEVVDRLARKHAAAAKLIPAPVVERHDGATIGIITVGSCDLAIREALDLLAKAGIAVDFMRIRGFPFATDVRQFLDDHDVCFVVEQNRDAQLRSLLAHRDARRPRANLRSVLVYGGFPLSAKHVVEGITRQLEA